MQNGELLTIAEELKALLLFQITHDGADQVRYSILRRQALSERRLDSFIPSFLRSDSTLLEVRRRSQALVVNSGEGKWAARKRWLADQFQPLFDYLQRPQMSSVEEVLSEYLNTVDSVHVRHTWDKAIERRQEDPEGAITIVRSLIETVCKHILGTKVEDKTCDLPTLYKQASKQLGLTEDQYADLPLKQIMRGCTQIVEGVGEFRNKMGDSHGKASLAPFAVPLQAELAVSVGGAMALFLLATWEANRTADTV